MTASASHVRGDEDHRTISLNRTLIPIAMQDTAPHGPTILIADDSTEQRALYVEILQSAGYRVLEAGDGEEAVAIVRRERPGLVLMDVTMPGTSGWNAVRILKEDPDTIGVPVIMVTGLAGSWDRDASIAAGADAYLAKPVPPARLMEEVRKFFPR
jgi:CheY-like chemotaxis protein